MTPPPPTPPPPMRLKPEGSGFVRFALILAGILVLAGIVIGVMSTFLHRAYVTVTPYNFSVAVEQSLPAAENSATLPYQKVEVTDTATKSVAATGSQHVENHASGTITVYNAYSTTPQHLITNTRFQTKDGLIFRIHSQITIPGYVMKAGLKVPGSVDAVVYADEAGEKYNVDLTDFTIPGLKGSAQFSLISARSKTAMSGGFIGEQAVVDTALRSQTVDGLRADLQRSLNGKVAAATVAGTLVFPDTITVSYVENPDTIQGNNAVISVSGKADAPAFNENALAHALGAASAGTYDGPLSIENPESLAVHVDQPDAVAADAALTLSLSGTANLVATFNRDQLAADLAGKQKKDIASVLPKYPGVSNIEVKVYPFWLSTLPSDPGKVGIQVVDTAPAGKP